MPLVRVHEASDGQLFRSYDEYVNHEQGLKFDKLWEQRFAQHITDDFDESTQDAISSFVYDNMDELEKLIQDVRIKRRGAPSKAK
ncbi:hypothetical protein [Acinetobacter brisouii]|uniref:hypothetical protein n=1 Tax=Acinetobacter brisouii TaxID=396323 RepID=UPI00124C10F7|nr:hypothetical protein [Acinetobacter brisouii]